MSRSAPSYRIISTGGGDSRRRRGASDRTENSPDLTFLTEEARNDGPTADICAAYPPAMAAAALDGIAALYNSSNWQGSSSSATASFAERHAVWVERSLQSVALGYPLLLRPTISADLHSNGYDSASSTSSSRDGSGSDEDDGRGTHHRQSSATTSSSSRRHRRALLGATDAFVDALYTMQSGGGGSGTPAAADGDDDRFATLTLAFDAIVMNAGECLQQVGERGGTASNGRRGGGGADGGIDLVPTASIRPLLSTCGLVTHAADDMAANGLTALVNGTDSIAAIATLLEAIAMSSVVGIGVSAGGDGGADAVGSGTVIPILPSSNYPHHSSDAVNRTRKVLLQGGGIPFLILCDGRDEATHAAMLMHHVVQRVGTSLMIKGMSAGAAAGIAGRLSLVFVVSNPEAGDDDDEDNTEEAHGEGVGDANGDKGATLARLTHSITYTLLKGKPLSSFQSAAGGGGGFSSSSPHLNSTNASLLSIERTRVGGAGSDALNDSRGVGASLLDSTVKSATTFRTVGVPSTVRDMLHATTPQLSQMLYASHPLIADLVVTPSARPTPPKVSGGRFALCNASSALSASVTTFKTVTNNGRSTATAFSADVLGMSNSTATTAYGSNHSNMIVGSTPTAFAAEIYPTAPTFVDVPLLVQLVGALVDEHQLSCAAAAAHSSSTKASHATRLAEAANEVLSHHLTVARRYTQTMLSGASAGHRAAAQSGLTLGGLIGSGGGCASSRFADEGGGYIRADASQGKERFVDVAFATLVTARAMAAATGGGASDDGDGDTFADASRMLAGIRPISEIVGDASAIVSQSLSVLLSLVGSVNGNDPLLKVGSGSGPSGDGKGRRGGGSSSCGNWVFAASQALARAGVGMPSDAKGAASSISSLIGYVAHSPLLSHILRFSAAASSNASGTGYRSDVPSALLASAPPAQLQFLFSKVLKPLINDAQRVVATEVRRGIVDGTQSGATGGRSAGGGGLLNCALSSKQLAKVRSLVEELAGPVEEAFGLEGVGVGKDDPIARLLASGSAQPTSTPNPALGDARLFTKAFKNDIADKVLFLAPSASPMMGPSSPTSPVAPQSPLRSNRPSTAVFSTSTTARSVPGSPHKTFETSTGVLYNRGDDLSASRQTKPLSVSLSELMAANNNIMSHPSPPSLASPTRRRAPTAATSSTPFEGAKPQAADHYARREVLLDTTLHWFIPNLQTILERDAATQRAQLAARDAITARLIADQGTQSSVMSDVKEAVTHIQLLVSQKAESEKRSLDSLKHVLQTRLKAEMEQKLVDLERRYASRRNYLLGEDFADANTPMAARLQEAGAALHQWRSPGSQASPSSPQRFGTPSRSPNGRATLSALAQTPTNKLVFSPHNTRGAAHASPTLLHPDLGAAADSHGSHLSPSRDDSSPRRSVTASPTGRTIDRDEGLLRKKLRQQQNRESLAGHAATVADNRKARVARSLGADGIPLDSTLAGVNEDEDDVEAEERRLLQQSSAADDVTLKMLKEFSQCCDRWLSQMLMPVLAQLTDVVITEEAHDAAARRSPSAGLLHGAIPYDGYGSAEQLTSDNLAHWVAKLKGLVEGGGGDVDIRQHSPQRGASVAATASDAGSPRRLRFADEAVANGDRENLAHQRVSATSPIKSSLRPQGSAVSPLSTLLSNNAFGNSLSATAQQQSTTARVASSGIKASSGSKGNVRSDLMDWLSDTKPTADAMGGRGGVARGTSSPSSMRKWSNPVWLKEQLMAARQLLGAAERALGDASQTNAGPALTATPRVEETHADDHSDRDKAPLSLSDKLKMSLSGAPPAVARTAAAPAVQTGLFSTVYPTDITTALSGGNGLASTLSIANASSVAAEAASRQHNNNSYATVLIQRLLRELELAKQSVLQSKMMANEAHAAARRKEEEMRALAVLLRNNASALSEAGLNNDGSGSGGDTGTGHFMSPQEAFSVDYANHLLSRERANAATLQQAYDSLRDEYDALRQQELQTADAALTSHKQLKAANKEIARLKGLNEQLQNANVKLHYEKAKLIAEVGEARHEQQVRGGGVQNNASSSNIATPAQSPTLSPRPLSIDVSTMYQTHNASYNDNNTSLTKQLEAFYREGKRIRNTTTTYSDPYPASLHLPAAQAGGGGMSSVNISTTSISGGIGIPPQRQPMPLGGGGVGSFVTPPSGQVSPAALTRIGNVSPSSLSTSFVSTNRGVGGGGSKIGGAPIPLSPPGFRAFPSKQQALNAIIDRDVEEVLEVSKYGGYSTLDTTGFLSRRQPIPITTSNGRVALDRSSSTHQHNNPTTKRPQHGQEPPSPVRRPPATRGVGPIDTSYSDPLHSAQSSVADRPLDRSTTHHNHNHQQAIRTSLFDMSQTGTMNNSRVWDLLPKEQMSRTGRERSEKGLSVEREREASVTNNSITFPDDSGIIMMSGGNMSAAARSDTRYNPAHVMGGTSLPNSRTSSPAARELPVPAVEHHRAPTSFNTYRGSGRHDVFPVSVTQTPNTSALNTSGAGESRGTSPSGRSLVVDRDPREAYLKARGVGVTYTTTSRTVSRAEERAVTM